MMMTNPLPWCSLAIFCSAALSPIPALAVEEIAVKITEEIPYITVNTGQEEIRVMRIQNEEHQLTGGFTKTSRKCPPFCFQPMQVAPGVTTVGEVEVIKFMDNQFRKGTGLIIDSRLSDWYQKGTIPGSVNVPFTIFDESGEHSKDLAEAFKLFGVKPKSKSDEPGFWDKLFGKDAKPSNWDFSQAKDLLMFCNGPWCEQSPTAIKRILSLGYPAKKIFYYRDGMQMWQLGGFTTVIPKPKS